MTPPKTRAGAALPHRVGPGAPLRIGSVAHPTCRACGSVYAVGERTCPNCAK